MRVSVLWIGVVLFLWAPTAIGQIPLGSWQDHLPYGQAAHVCVGSEKIYTSTGFSLFSYNRESLELEKLSKVQGLSECGISAIHYNTARNALIIAYESGTIDILENNRLFTLSDIAREYIPGVKNIHGIHSHGDEAYLACSFGIVVLNLEKTEIKDTWLPGREGGYTDVLATTKTGNTFYAVTENGLFSGDPLQHDLAYFGNWEQEDTLRFTSDCKLITSSSATVYLYKELMGTDSLLIIREEGITSHPLVNKERHSLNFSDSKLVFSAGNTIEIYSPDGIHEKTIDSYGWGIPAARDAVLSDGVLWIADGSAGLVEGFPDQLVFNGIAPDGPLTHHAYQLVYEGSTLWVAGGGVTNSWNNVFRNGEIFRFQKNQWSSIVNYDVRDILTVLPDPGMENRIYAASWGGGLLEYQGNELIRQFNQYNSPLQSIIPGSDYSRIKGLAWDANRNLWITQTGVEGSVKVLKPDGDWVVFPMNLTVPTIGNILITSWNHKWILLPRGYGLYVYHDNNSLEDFSDDQETTLSVSDQDGNPLNTIYAMAEDKEGNIWLGTDQGPAVFYNPERVMTDEIRAYRIKIPRNDGTPLADYLLGNETITAIAVDGGNRKWLGTQNAGVFLISANGQEEIHHFTEDNSPLPSNQVYSIAINPENGLVSFGTEKGISSFRAEATEGGTDFENVYAFPNPVRENYRGPITITGLAANVDVKITTISGTLVYQTTALGGQAIWDGTNGAGKRVSTGVYIVFCTNSDGSKTHTTKILFIR